jgi:hypothetical protein
MTSFFITVFNGISVDLGFEDRGSFDQKSVDQNCHFSVDRNFHNQLTEMFDAFQLIETFNNEFDQTPKI